MDDIDFSRDNSELIVDHQAKPEAMGHIRLGKDAGHREDAAKPNLQRQGHWIDLQDKVSPALLHEPELGQFTDINSMYVVKPGYDITAPGNCNIRIRENNKSGDGRQLAYVYSPSGKVCGTVAPTRLLQLYKAVQHIRTHRSDTHEQYNNPTFEQAVMRLLNRYPVIPKDDAEKKRAQTHWKTPEAFMGGTQKRATSHHRNICIATELSPHFENYFSPFAEDQLYEANHNACSMKWTGSSQARPEWYDAETDIAIRWAIASTDTPEPVLTAFVLP